MPLRLNGGEGGGVDEVEHNDVWEHGLTRVVRCRQNVLEIRSSILEMGPKTSLK